MKYLGLLNQGTGPAIDDCEAVTAVISRQPVALPAVGHRLIGFRFGGLGFRV